jgi:hypothetical protein
MHTAISSESFRSSGAIVRRGPERLSFADAEAAYLEAKSAHAAAAHIFSQSEGAYFAKSSSSGEAEGALYSEIVGEAEATVSAAMEQLNAAAEVLAQTPVADIAGVARKIRLLVGEFGDLSDSDHVAAVLADLERLALAERRH